MAPIDRIGPSRLSPTRSRSVIHDGVVTTVATSSTKVPSLYEQARDALATIDRNLREAGTDKSRILMVMAYITDIALKPEFNRAWDEWVDPRKFPRLRDRGGGIRLACFCWIETAGSRFSGRPFEAAQSIPGRDR